MLAACAAGGERADLQPALGVASGTALDAAKASNRRRVSSLAAWETLPRPKRALARCGAGLWNED